jgi:adenylate cyclase class IV/GNAT superfamily N-acetyltransferase
MARNIEIKARIDSVAALEPRAAAIADTGPELILQDDTFFHCPTGRLKLRAFPAGDGELIFYRRANQQGPTESFYLRSPTPTPDVLRESLTLAWGQAGRVVKRRVLYLTGRTRIHLDDVAGLGHFLELEVVLREGEAAEDGVREARVLMEQLDVQSSQLVEGAYVDLITASGAGLGAAPAGPVLRPGTPQDGDCIGVLAMQVFLDTYATEGVRPDLAREVLAGYSPAAFEARLTAADSHFILAESSGHLLGFAELALGRPPPGSAQGDGTELVRLYVQRPFQGQGVGTALLRGAEQLAAGASQRTLWLTSWEGNARALDFYRRRGFEEQGTTVHTIEGRPYGNRVLVKPPSAAATALQP